MTQRMAGVELLARQAIGGGGELQAGVETQPIAPAAPGSADGTLNTVGLALLAYGLVQLLAKAIDKMPIGRGAERRGDSWGFTEEDRKRLERGTELLAAEADRAARINDRLEIQQRLVGQALDQLRELDKKQDNTLRKLRALWRRLGRRLGDRD